MTPKRSNRCFVIALSWVIRGTRAANASLKRRRVQRHGRAAASVQTALQRVTHGVAATVTALRSNDALRRVVVTITLPVRRGVEGLVRWVGGDGDDAHTLTVCVLVAAAGAGALAVLGIYAGAGTSDLLDIAAALAVGALAVGTAVILVRRRLGHGRSINLRDLVTSAIARIDSKHHHGPAVRALTVVCEPSRLLPTRQMLPNAVEYVAQRALKTLIKHPVRYVPMMGAALDVMSAYQNTVDSARFVQQFALTAVEVCCDDVPCLDVPCDEAA